MKQLLLDLSPGKPALSNFVAGRNEELLARLRGLFDAGQAERMIYLWGEEGCGRTHLLRACAEEASNAALEAVYVSCSPDTRFELDADFVAADDVGNLDGEGQVSLFHLYNRLKEKGGILVSSGSAPPSLMALRDDLSTRLGWGLVYQLHLLLDGEKREALRAHAGSRGFEISVEVVDYLMHHMRRDMPTLLKMLDALDEFSLQSRRPITVPMLKEIIERMKCA